jgi:hypothetical protein
MERKFGHQLAETSALPHTSQYSNLLEQDQLAPTCCATNLRLRHLQLANKLPLEQLRRRQPFSMRSRV